MRKRLANLAAIGVLLTGGWGFSDSPDSPQFKGIVRITRDLAKAFNQGDAKALAALWSEDGVYLSHQTGERIKGRQAIENDYAARLKNIKGAHIELTVDAVRLVTPDVATLDGSAQVLRLGELPTHSNFTMVLAKKTGAWLIDSVREVDLPGPATNHAQLSELDWMEGTWVNQDNDYEVRVVCEWVANKNFLARRYTVARQDTVELQGTQIVGWDASQKRLRSWFFDSDGSFGEGAWKRSGKRWTIQASGILPSGSKATATQIITKIDNNKFTWQAIGRDVAGVPQPNLDPVTLVRQKNEPAARGKE